MGLSSKTPTWCSASMAIWPTMADQQGLIKISYRRRAAKRITPLHPQTHSRHPTITRRCPPEESTAPAGAFHLPVDNGQLQPGNSGHAGRNRRNIDRLTGKKNNGLRPVVLEKIMLLADLLANGTKDLLARKFSSPASANLIDGAGERT